MYSWERKFGDVVKDTEKHLSKARQTLDTTSHRNGYRSISGDSMEFHRNYPSENKPSARSFSSSHLHEIRKDSGYGSYQLYPATQDHSSGLVAILSEKIDRQGKLIEDLTRQVLTLERENEKSSLRLRSVEQEVTSLRRRMAENGVHIETEQKVDRYQWEMRAKLDDLKLQMETQNKLGVLSSIPPEQDWRYALTEELRDLKKHVERECDSLYHEIEVIRSKLVRYEVELTGQHGDSKELARQVERLKQEFETSASKVSAQLSNLSASSKDAAVDRLFSSCRNGDPSHHTKAIKPLKTLSSVDSEPALPLPKSRQKRRKFKSSEPARNHLSHRPDRNPSNQLKYKTTSELLSSSTDDFSSDSNEGLSKANTGQSETTPKDTDDSLTLSDLDLEDKSDTIQSSLHGVGALSIDSDSLDLDV